MPDTPRFDDPQNLVVAALVDMYGRGLIPAEHTVSSMGIVVDYIQRFDQQKLDPAWLATNVSRLDSLVVRLLKSLLLELTQLDFLLAFVDSSLANMGPKSSYARPLGPNSLVGGFFKDVLTNFLAAEFDVRLALWQGFCDYVKTFGVPTSSSSAPTEHLPDIICANDTFRAIDLIHKQSDLTRAMPDAMNIILRVLAQGGYVSETFALAESALTAVRSTVKPKGRKMLLHTLSYMGRLMLAYPRLVPAKFVISLDSLLSMLRTDPDMNPFAFLTLELFYLLSQGAPLPLLVDKMAPMVASCFDQTDNVQNEKDRRKLVHHLSFLVWSRHGKRELAQIHLDMLDKLGEPVPTRFALLAQEALHRDPEAALKKLETLRPQDNCILQAHNLARLVLRVLSLTRAQKFAAAAEVLKVVHAFPMELEETWVHTIKCAEIQLLLAQQKTQQALELAQENLAAELPLHRTQMLVYSARALCEYPLRRSEALELARECFKCNSVPLATEAQVIEATALSFEDAASALAKATALAPKARDLSPRLYVDCLVVRASCLVQLRGQTEGEASLALALAAYNEAQIEINREPVLSHVRQVHNLRLELLKETSDLVEPTTKFSLVENDLKRKSTVWERRPSKRRSLNA